MASYKLPNSYYAMRSRSMYDDPTYVYPMGVLTKWPPFEAAAVFQWFLWLSWFGLLLPFSKSLKNGHPKLLKYVATFIEVTGIFTTICRLIFDPYSDHKGRQALFSISTLACFASMAIWTRWTRSTSQAPPSTLWGYISLRTLHGIPIEQPLIDLIGLYMHVLKVHAIFHRRATYGPLKYRLLQTITYCALIWLKDNGTLQQWIDAVKQFVTPAAYIDNAIKASTGSLNGKIIDLDRKHTEHGTSLSAAASAQDGLREQLKAVLGNADSMSANLLGLLEYAKADHHCSHCQDLRVDQSALIKQLHDRVAYLEEQITRGNDSPLPPPASPAVDPVIVQQLQERMDKFEQRNSRGNDSSALPPASSIADPLPAAGNESLSHPSSVASSSAPSADLSRLETTPGSRKDRKNRKNKVGKYGEPPTEVPGDTTPASPSAAPPLSPSDPASATAERSSSLSAPPPLPVAATPPPPVASPAPAPPAAPTMGVADLARRFGGRPRPTGLEGSKQYVAASMEIAGSANNIVVRSETMLTRTELVETVPNDGQPPSLTSREDDEVAVPPALTTSPVSTADSPPSDSENPDIAASSGLSNVGDPAVDFFSTSIFSAPPSTHDNDATSSSSSPTTEVQVNQAETRAIVTRPSLVAFRSYATRIPQDSAIPLRPAVLSPPSPAPSAPLFSPPPPTSTTTFTLAPAAVYSHPSVPGPSRCPAQIPPDPDSKRSQRKAELTGEKYKTKDKSGTCTICGNGRFATEYCTHGHCLRCNGKGHEARYCPSKQEKKKEE